MLPSTPVTVLAVDDSARFLRAARELVGCTPGFAWAGEAGSGPDGLALAERVRPDLVLLDVRMPGMDGPEAARRLLARDPDVVVVLVTAGDLDGAADAARHSGARALVAKEQLSPDLLRELWGAEAA